MTVIREAYEDDHLDELVADDAFVHIERLSKRNWMLIVRTGGQTIHMNVRDLTIYERDLARPEEEA